VWNISAGRGVFIRNEDVMREPNQDRELLRRLQSGDETALGELADAYSAKIYQLAFRYLRNKEDAEEVTQDVLYKVYRKVGAFRGESALSSWIYRITFNTAMSRVRTAGFQRVRAEESHSAAEGEEATGRYEVADWSDLADEQVFRAQMRQRVMAAIMALPAIYRAPVVLRDLQGMSTEEASAVLKVKDQTLKSRLHRGRLILRRELADFAGGLSLHQAAA
jgi:RNA polymerase sigma-70 factor (ECF subfamily)